MSFEVFNTHGEEPEDKHNIDWKLILKKNGDEMYRANEKLKLDEPQYKLDFNPFPSSAVQRKIDYYFLPYNYNQSVARYMKFEEEDAHPDQWGCIDDLMFK